MFPQFATAKLGDRTITKRIDSNMSDADVQKLFAQDYADEGYGRAGRVIDQSVKNPWQMSASKPTMGEALQYRLGDALGGGRDGQRYAKKAFRFINDATPVGNVTGMDEGGRMARDGWQRGHLGQAALGAGIFALSAAPIPGGVKRAGKGMFGNLLRDEAGTFAGRGAKTADLAALARAEDMAGQGLDRRQIWDDTGWYKGVDDKWRFEIDDSGSSFQDFTKPREIEYLGDRMKHPRAFEAYEDAPRITTVAGGGDGGYYQRPGRADPNDFGVLSVGVGSDQRSTASHELQHFIQGQEDFARGGSAKAFASQRDLAMAQVRSINQRLGEVAKAMDSASGPELDALKREYDELMTRKLTDYVPKSNVDPMQQYRRLAGEVEARNVQTRLDWTPEQRRATPPWETQDIADEDQIVRFDANGPQMAIRAWHASNDDFAKFESGHGRTAADLYFAPNREDATHYGKRLYEVSIDDSAAIDIVNRGPREYEALRKAYDEGGMDDWFNSFDEFVEAIDGGDMYQRFASQHAQNDMIGALAEQGFPVIRMPDAGFGGSMSESYVVTDPSLVDILNKY